MGALEAIDHYTSPEELQLPIPLRELWKEAVPIRRIGQESLQPCKFRQYGQILLRCHRYEDLYDDGRLEVVPSVATSIKVFRSHITRLQHMGLRVATFKSEPVKGARRTDNPDRAQQMCGYSATHLSLEATPLQTSCWSDQARIPEHLHESVQATNDVLGSYLDWVHSSDQKYILSDIFRATQYSESPQEGILFLHDIDPYVEQRSPSLLNDSRKTLAE